MALRGCACTHRVQTSSNAILQQPGTQPAGQPASRVAGSAGQPDSRSARQPAGQRLKAPFTKIPLTLRPRVLSQHPLLFAAVPAATFLASPRVSDTGIRPLRGSTGEVIDPVRILEAPPSIFLQSK